MDAATLPDHEATRADIKRDGVSSARGTLARRLENVGPLLILALMCIVLSVIEPRFATLGNLQTVLNEAAIPLVVASGLTLVVLMGSIDLSVEGLMASCSIVVSLLVLNSSNSLDLGVAGILVALILGALFGFANGFIHARFALPSLMVTLGTWFVGLGLASYLFPGRQPAIQDAGFRELALGKVLGLSYMFWIAIVIVIALVLMLRFTHFGRMIIAMGPGQAQLVIAGVPVNRYRIGAFTICGTLAGLAGIMTTAQIGAGSATAGADQLFPAVSAVVIGGTLLTGGRGGILQTFVGVLLLAVISNGLLFLGVNPYVQQAVIGIALIGIVAATTWRARRKLAVVK